MRLVVREKVWQRILMNYQWCKDLYGEVIARHFYEKVKRNIDRLIVFPFIGRREELLAHRPYDYRSLSIHSHFRLIYHVDEAKSEIHVVDFWDMRQDPASLVEGFAEE